MLSGLAAVVGQGAITAIVNTGDDMVLHGLHISPDIDTVTYTLAGAANPATGWGLSLSPGPSWGRCGPSKRRPPGRACLRGSTSGTGTWRRTCSGRAGWARGRDPVRGDRRGGPPLRRRGAVAAHERRPGRDQADDRASGRLRRTSGEVLPAWAAAPAPARDGPGAGGDRVPGVLRRPAPRRGRQSRPFRRRVVGRPRPGGPGRRRTGRARRHLPFQPDRVDRPGPRRTRDRRRGGPAAGDDCGRLPHHRRKGPEGPGRPHAGRARLRGIGRRGGQALGAFRRHPRRRHRRRRAGARVEAQGTRCIVAPSVMSGPAQARDLAEVVLGARP